MQINLHSMTTADRKSEEGGNYVKSSRRDLCKMGCNTLDSESASRRQRCKSESNLKTFVVWIIFWNSKIWNRNCK